MLKYGRDTYGPKHTPLFVDGLNIHTHEPVKWIAPNGDSWVLSNLASQQTFFRTLVGLTTITDDPKYKQAAMDAIKYAFENLRTPNGLLYWGGHCAYDAEGDKPCGRDVHELKGFYPYYELMWHVDSKATRQFVDAFWSGHVKDWSNLQFDRHCYNLTRPLGAPWNHEYKGGPVFFGDSGSDMMHAGSDLFYAAALLTRLSGDEAPLVWGRRLAQRYIEARNPRTGISPLGFSAKLTPYTHEFPRPFFSNPALWANQRYYYMPTPGAVVSHITRVWLCELLLGETLGSDGQDFTRWALDELTTIGKKCYQPRRNVYVPISGDGASREGYVSRNDGFFGPKGTRLMAIPAKPYDFLAYMVAYRSTKDEFMWKTARDIARGNGYGDIGASATVEPRLNYDSADPDPYGLLAFLELYRTTGSPKALKMAEHIGDAILAERFHNGFFVGGAGLVFCKFDAIDSLALLHLYASARGQSGVELPQVWPGTSFFDMAYRNKEEVIDNLIYAQNELPLAISLQEAAAIGDIDLVRSLVAKGADIDGREDSFLKTALHHAAMNGHREIAEFLLAKGANVNAKDDFPGGTPLHYAVENGSKDVVEVLIDSGADINVKNNNGQTPLDVALRRDHKEIVELLAKVTDVSSIHTAAQLGDLNKVKAFLEQGTDINTKNQEGMTPLLLGVSSRQAEVVGFLVENGADVNTRDKEGYTPLVCALWNVDPNMVRLLLDKGADVNAKDTAMGLTVLHWAILMDPRESTQLILAAGADVNAKSNSGETPLDFAAYRASAGMGELLMAKGAEVTSLHAAAYVGDIDKVESFIDGGAEVNQKKGMIEGTALHAAAAGGRKEVIEFLIDKGSAVNAQNRAGQTPLHLAAGAGHLEVVQLLLENGADVTIKGGRGHTALDLARRAEHNEIVELLKERIPSSRVLPSDIAIISVSAPSTCVQGDAVPVAVAITNKSSERQELRFALRDADTRLEIAAQALTLEPEGYRLANTADLILSPPPSCQGVFGWGMNIGGDINHDGYADLLIGAGKADEARGRVCLYYGSRDMKADPHMILDGENRGDHFTCPALGDVNGDGFDDVIIGAWGYNNEDGRVYIFFGGVDMDKEPDLILDGERGKAGALSCNCLSVGDVDKDGYIDVLVGSCGYDKKRGRAYLYYGGDPMDNSADVIFEGEHAQDVFGRNAVIGQDVDGDGYRDILIGARKAPEGRRNGRAYLYYGGDRDHMDAVCDIRFAPPDSGVQEFGSSLDIFDIDNDGYADIVSGAREGQEFLDFSRGGVFLYWGDTRDKMNAVADVIIWGEKGAQSSLGGDRLFCADFNRDGYGDIAVGAYNWHQRKRIGRTYVYYGGTKTSIDTEPDAIFTGEEEDNYFGHDIGGGDFNNDGYTDLVVGAWGYNNEEGKAYVFLGPLRDDTAITFNWDTANASIGTHTIKVEVTPVPVEENTGDNVKTITIEVTEPTG